MSRSGEDAAELGYYEPAAFEKYAYFQGTYVCSPGTYRLSTLSPKNI